MKWPINHIMAYLAPHLCVRCGREGALVCGKCKSFIAIKKAETCFRCNRLSPNSRTCRSCRKSSVIRSVFVASSYQGEVKQLIHQLKYENCIDAAEPLGELLVLRLSRVGVYDFIVAVPSSSRRYRQRGYNQAEEIAKILARKLEIKRLNCLRRVGHAEQVGAGRTLRLEQLKGAIKADGGDLNGANILLVDDVVTTGATIEECGKALKAMGAGSIDSIVAAKQS